MNTSERSESGTDASKDDNCEGWGHYMNVKKQKLDEQFDDAVAAISSLETKSTIFKDIAIFVNGYTGISVRRPTLYTFEKIDPSASELRQLMMAHGGAFHTYQLSTTTHVVVSNLPYSKIAQLKVGDRVIRPDWIVDCIKAGALLPDVPYLYLKPSDIGQSTLKEKWRRLASPAKATDAAGCSSAKATITSDKIREFPKTNDDDFLSEFYSHSRLHFISMLGQKMKDYVRKLKRSAQASTDVNTERSDLFADVLSKSDREAFKLETNEKVFMHLDMDCFFVAVVIRDKPELQGKPVVITHSKGRGPASSVGTSGQFSSRAEIASCSYEARKFGLKNGMYLGGAMELCPDLVTADYNFEEYETVSKQMYDIIMRFTLNIEPVSCDEMYVDLTDICSSLQIDPLTVAEKVRNIIFETTRCTASAGIGANMLLARLATKHAKPNGQFYVCRAKGEQFMADQKVSELPGVGYQTLEKLTSRFGQISSCGELRNKIDSNLSVLHKLLGQKQGETFFNQLSGKDERNISSEIVARKSVSCDVNYGIRIKTEDEACQFLENLSKEVARRLADCQMMGKSITLKFLVRSPDAPIETPKYMGCGNCFALTKQTALAVAVCDPKLIGKHCCQMLRTLKPVICDLRGIGISIHKLEPISVNSKGQQTSLNAAFSRAAAKQLEADLSGPCPDVVAIDLQELDAENSRSSSKSDDEKSVEIDKSILEALPVDIREEVLRDLKNGNQHSGFTGINANRKSFSDTVLPGLSGDISQAGASSSKNPESNSRSVVRGKLSKVMEGLPEGIDLECFNALPFDLQVELKHSFKQSRCEASKRANSETGFNSVRKTPKKKGTVKKRGKSKDPAPVAMGNLTRHFNVTAATNVRVVVGNDIDDECSRDSVQTVSSVTTTQGCEMMTGDDVIVIDQIEDKTELPIFFGQSDYGGVRTMIQRWVRSCKEPTKIDIDMFIAYLMSLIDLRQVETVMWFLRSFFRFIVAKDQIDRSCWQNVFVIVKSAVSESLLTVYKMPFKFDENLQF